MIDFRYHLVSLAAVLIALSVGIVLGAGPLNDDIGNTLSGEVTKLRGEKDELRRQLADSERGGERRDAFDEAHLAQLVDGELDDRTVTVVALPGTDDAVVDDLATTLRDAGAKVGEPVSLEAEWVSTDDGAAGSRRTVGDQLVADLGLAPNDGELPLDLALGAVLSGREGDSDVPADARTGAWDRLREDGFVSGPTDLPDPAQLVVVVAPAPQGQIDEAATPEAEGWVRLARTLDSSSSGAVLTGPEDPGGSDPVVSVLARARADAKLSDGLSTVDSPDVPMGRAVVVLALREQADGGAGHYGLGADASAALPDAS